MGQFGDLQALLAKPEGIRKPSIRESVRRNAERIRRNYELIRLDGAEKLPFELAQLHWQDTGMTTTGVLKKIGLQ